LSDAEEAVERRGGGCARWLSFKWFDKGGLLAQELQCAAFLSL
jgi:hypothetical protein